MTGRRVVIAATVIAVGLLVTAGVSEHVDWGLPADRVGNAGEWFAGIAGAAVLAWSVGEPERLRRHERRESDRRVARQAAWEDFHDALEPMRQGLFQRSQLADEVEALAKAHDLAADEEYRMRNRSGPKPRAVRHRAESIADTRCDAPPVLLRHLPNVLKAMRSLVEEHDLEQLKRPLGTMERLEAYVRTMKRPPDTAQSLLDWLIAHPEESEDPVVRKAYAAISALLSLANFYRREPGDSFIDMCVPSVRTDQVTDTSVHLVALRDELEKVSASS